jgi:murein DD-endopeptidase MepM/ murein hydrolase activator NlpD
VTTPATHAARVRAALAALITGAILVSAMTLPAAADEYDDRKAQAEARQAATDQAMADLEAELEHTDAALVQAYAELQGIQAQIPVAEQQLAAAEELLAQLQREAAIIAERLEVAKAEEAKISGQIEADAERADQIGAAIGRMAREAYRGDIAASSLSAVLDAQSTDEFVEQSAMASTALRTQTQALRDLEQINGVNRNRQVRLVAVREQITELKAEADAKVAEAEVARQAAADRKAELDQLLVEQQQKTALIEAQKADQLAKQRELEAQQAQLAADLAEIVRLQDEQRRAEAAAAAAAAAAAGKPAPPPSQGSTVDRPFINPSSVNPMYVTSDYGMRFHPILQYWRLHAGTDLRTWCSTPIYAAASGTVEWARARSGYGNQVMINHGYWKGSSLMSSYNHLNGFAVSGGQNVSQGQLIGYAGNTVDPRPLING